MARYGMNPARNKRISYQPSRVTAALMCYIPNLEGYFSHRLDVLKLSLESLIKTVGATADILIMDNGSCREVRAYLESQLASGRIDYLIHSSRNLGVIGGFKVLFNAAPGELVAYCDDDVLYYPGWLEAHLEILDTYPRVGMVSGAPVGYSSEQAVDAVESFIHDNSESVTTSLTPRLPDWERSWAVSTGRTVEDHLQKIQDTPHRLLEYHDVKAVQSAKHFQFLAPKEIIREAFDPAWSGLLMDGLVELDRAVDNLGFLRLTTPERYSRHIGNTLSAEIIAEGEKMNLSVSGEVPDVKQFQHWLLRIPGSGRILWPLYRWLFKVLHGVN
jgi:glycosyltransferase involved in cell wall biosynthesis